MPAGRVLLISPPWRSPEEADLGLATLKPILREAGIAADLLHGTHLFPYSRSNFMLRGLYASFYFAPYLYPDVTPEMAVEAAVDTYLLDSNMQGLRLPPQSASFRALDMGTRSMHERDAREDIERAGICLDRCVERAAAGGYDVVGFSCTFELQLIAGLAIARRLRERRPATRIIFGGAACLGEPAEELVRVFRFIDAVCHGEGDDVIVPLVRALLDGHPLDQVPGIAWVDERGRVRRNESPPLVADLDRLPMPDYDDYVAQLAASEWGHRPPRLHFETSRGCWWGQKHLCTFCGLNAQGLRYRRKSPERALAEILHLHRRYPTARRLHATDNILDMDYLRSLMPHLAELNRTLARPVRMFWEIKSNLRSDQVAALAAAGTDYAQPGIESFSDEILQLMRKGASGLGQVQHIKYLCEQGIEAAYQIIIANPGETDEMYREMTALIPYIEHLPPPRIVTMELQRFSPYFTAPESYGISNIRPKPYYRLLYHDPRADPARLAYCFDYDHPSLVDPDLIEAQRAFVRAGIAWYQGYRPWRAGYRDQGDHIVVLDRRRAVPGAWRLAGPAAELFRYLDRTRRLGAVHRRFPHLDPDLVRCLLDTWHHRRWICRDRRERLLGVLPRLPPAAATPRIDLPRPPVGPL